MNVIFASLLLAGTPANLDLNRLNEIELSADQGASVVYHILGPDADVREINEDGRTILLIVPREAGKLTLLLTIVNFETKKLTSKKLEFIVEGPKPDPNKPVIRPEPIDPVEPTDPIGDKDLLDLIPERSKELKKNCVTLADALEDNKSSVKIGLWSHEIGSRDLETLRSQIAKVISAIMSQSKSDHRPTDDADYRPFLSAVSQHLNKYDSAHTYLSELVRILRAI